MFGKMSLEPVNEKREEYRKDLALDQQKYNNFPSIHDRNFTTAHAKSYQSIGLGKELAKPTAKTNSNAFINNAVNMFNSPTHMRQPTNNLNSKSSRIEFQ